MDKTWRAVRGNCGSDKDGWWDISHSDGTYMCLTTCYNDVGGKRAKHIVKLHNDYIKKSHKVTSNKIKEII
jgi:hypothetical protein